MALMAMGNGGKQLSWRKSAELLFGGGLPTNIPEIGDEFEEDRTFSEEEVQAFLDVTGDNNPIHTEEDAARASGFPGPILPGMLCASMIPALIARKYPGAVYLSQSLKFRQYALVGSEVQIKVAVDSINKSQVKFESTVYRKDGSIVLDGYALAMIE